MDALIGLDLGTSNLKGVLAATHGQSVVCASEPTCLLHPRSGWVEFDAARYVAAVFKLIRRLLSDAPAHLRVTAIAVSGASGCTLLLDENNRPLANAISWMDQRVVNESMQEIPGIDMDGVHRIAGWPYAGMMPLACLNWIRRQRPELWTNVVGVSSDLDYVLYCLTGRRGVDYSTATTLYLADQVNRCWHQPYLDALGLSPQALPPLMDSGTVLGKLTAEAAQATSLPRNVSVVLGAFDHPSAARGTGVLTEGTALLSCGTSWVGFYPMHDRDTAIELGLLVDPFLYPDGPWGTMFSLPCIGERIDAYIRHLCPGAEPFAQANDAAASAPAGANGLTIDLDVPPESLSVNNHPDSCRAVVEAVAFRMHDRVSQLADAGISANSFVMVGGASAGTVWPSLLADVLNVPIILPDQSKYTGALGAAIIAGVSAGFFDNDHAGFQVLRRDNRLVQPDPRRAARYAELVAKRATKSRSS